MSNIYFKHRSVHKYTRMASGQDRVDIKSMIDLVRYVQDVKVVRGMERGLSIHHVLCKVRLVGAWIERREVGG